MLSHRTDLPTFVSFAIHRDLLTHDLYPSLLDGLKDVVCVSPHSELPHLLTSRFGVRSATSITVRRAHSLRNTVAADEQALALPEQCDAVISRLDNDLTGRLVIVGAGYLGKRITHEAMKRGAVALDLGSIPDYWMGKRTRAYLDI
jgi:hypothetical protein